MYTSARRKIVIKHNAYKKLGRELTISFNLICSFCRVRIIAFSHDARPRIDIALIVLSEGTKKQLTMEEQNRR